MRFKTLRFCSILSKRPARSDFTLLVVGLHTRTPREQARKDRDFLTADKIRDDLVAQGVVLEDAAGGTSWHRK